MLIVPTFIQKDKNCFENFCGINHLSSVITFKNIRFYMEKNRNRMYNEKIKRTVTPGRAHECVGRRCLRAKSRERPEYDQRHGGKIVKILGNIIWFVFGGLITAIEWALFGLLWCITVVGIPIGVQCFKVAKLVILPFGKSVENHGGVGSFIVNAIWFFIGGLEIALTHLLIGIVFCITIVGIPFGMQHFKFAKLAIMPFGSKIK